MKLKVSIIRWFSLGFLSLFIGVLFVHKYQTNFEGGKTLHSPSTIVRKRQTPLQRSKKALSKTLPKNLSISSLSKYLNVSSISDILLGRNAKIESDEGNCLRNIEPENAASQQIQIVQSAAITHKQLTSADYLPQKAQLPSFASDHSEFVLGSIIERSMSWDLFLTTFMLCHFMLDPSNREHKKVHSGTKYNWQHAVSKFKIAEYLRSGSRSQERADSKFYCNIKHSPSSPSYTVPGYFMPNELAQNSNDNRKLDILRCPIVDPQTAYSDFAGSLGSLYVEIIRGNKTIVSFAVPWSTRKTGFLLSTPPAASALNTWKGYNMIEKTIPTKEKIDKLHICVPSFERYPSKRMLPVLLEFISHHLLIGVSHIHLPLTFPWNSVHMNKYIDIFQSYIQEGIMFLFFTILNLYYTYLLIFIVFAEFHFLHYRPLLSIVSLCLMNSNKEFGQHYS
jgi:hypothetical protein